MKNEQNENPEVRLNEIQRLRQETKRAIESGNLSELDTARMTNYLNALDAEEQAIKKALGLIVETLDNDERAGVILPKDGDDRPGIIYIGPGEPGQGGDGGNGGNGQYPIQKYTPASDVPGHKTLRVTDNATGELELQVDLTGDYAVQYVREDGYIARKGQITNSKFGGDHEIKNLFYSPIAARLCERFDELSHIRVDRILFIENTSWEPPKGGQKKWTWIARIKKAADMLTNTWGYDYVMELKAWYTSQMSAEKIIALVYHELRHIGVEGDLLHHDVEDWSALVATLGVNWATSTKEIIDLLGPEFEGFDALRTVGQQLAISDESGAAAMTAGV